MDGSSHSTSRSTWNVKKTKKYEAKKRKLDAFMNLIATDDRKLSLKKKKSNESLEESYKALRGELQKYTKKKEKAPFFSLTPIGFKAHVDLRNYKTSPKTFPLFIQDIHHLLLRSLLGSIAPYDCRWAKIERPENLVKTVLLVIDGLTKNSFVGNLASMQDVIDIFPITVEYASSNSSFANELSTLHLVSDAYFKDKIAYSSLFPVEEKVVDKVPKKNKLSKLHLLLSPVQLVMEHYPLPKSIYEHSICDNYVFTKDLYSPVTDSSPMFALDCEMCQTVKSHNEVTRIAVVDEQLEVVYHSFVKPIDKVVDYRTKFSGVTQEMLRNVYVRLSDVHKELQRILPRDAILCGQSLNCDLHALRMIHPYIIDTSVIFNQSGIRGKKNSLRSLAADYLKESIQLSKHGHNPVEDSIASMKLVQVKLDNSIQFGDAVLAPPKTGESSSADSEAKEPEKVSEENKISHDSDSGSKDGFFSRIVKASKKACLIGTSESLASYPVDMLPEEIVKIPKSNAKKVFKCTLNNLETYDFLVTHMQFEDEETSLTFSEVNDKIKELFHSCPSRTLVMVIASGVTKSTTNEINSGLCMTALKK
ncbi:RNA exonuclease 5-like [Uloborus diversus]|uniref:RNA exonuclease 5-like n=1 Tax=Uloborus diversus TaxID=327109 RepID=UPI00240A0EDE|nr:RNA exonuclease 5-like [Uloborus diversus]